MSTDPVEAGGTVWVVDAAGERVALGALSEMSVKISSGEALARFGQAGALSEMSVKALARFGQAAVDAGASLEEFHGLASGLVILPSGRSFLPQLWEAQLWEAQLWEAERIRVQLWEAERLRAEHRRQLWEGERIEQRDAATTRATGSRLLLYLAGLATGGEHHA